MEVLTRIAIAVAAAGLAGCYDPGSPPAGRCEVSCSMDGACPGDLTCLADKFCHVPGEDVCSAADFVRREQFAGGADHACAIGADRSLSCWGTNADGELGDAQIDRSAVPVPVGIPSHEHWAAVAAGATSTCAIDVDGVLMCWGDATNGRLPIAAGGTKVSPTVIDKPGTGSWLTVALAANHGCAVFRPDDTSAEFGGDLYCWGDDTHGEVGVTGSPAGPYMTPTRVDLAELAGYRDWIDVGVGESIISHQTCARRQGGVVWCWGEGNAAGPMHTHDEAVTQPGEFFRLSVGDLMTCGSTSAGEVYCWGVYDTMYSGAIAQRVPDELLPQATSWTGVAAGRFHACALSDAGAIHCFGDTVLGQRGEYEPSPPSSHGTDIVLDNATPTDLGAGDDFTCATTAAGWQCWGYNRNGQLGRGSFGEEPQLAQLRSDITWTTVASGTWISCGIGHIGAAASTLYCWGTSNYHLTLPGTGLTTSAAPVAITTADVPVAVAVADDHACYSTVDRTYCWGNGMLGDGTTNPSDVPIAVLDQSSNPMVLTRVTAGHHSTCGVAADHTIYCWGEVLNNLLSPFQVNPVITLAASGDQLVQGTQAACATSSDALWCWGTFRMPGNTFVTQQLNAQQIALPAMFQGPAAPPPTPMIAVGREHICAHHAGYVMCWGKNDHGQAGPGAGTDVLSPTNTGLYMPSTQLGAAEDYTCVGSTSGVVATGPVCFGMLAGMPQPGPTTRYESTQVFSLAATHGCLLDSSGAYCWGHDDHNELGAGIGFDPHPAVVVSQ